MPVATLLANATCSGGGTSVCPGWCYQRSRHAKSQEGKVRGRDQVKLTLGAARISGRSISSSCAGVNANMFATMLLGNTSRAVL